jgi:tripartite-type tricarboxylate transporter receptor subunit TctC
LQTCEKKNLMRETCKRSLLIATLLLTASAAAFAQGNAASSYPGKPIRFIVPFTPGSASDILARTIGERLAATWGQPVSVENRPGAGGVIATGQVAKSEPDGYTLIVVSAGHVVNPLLYGNLPYDTLKDFAGVVPFASLPSVLYVAPALGVSSVQELVALAKARPGVLNFASGGTGSASHVNAEKFIAATGIDVVHVPLKGAPEMVTETIGGRTHFGFLPIIAALPTLRGGRLRALAVSSKARAGTLADTPTMAEAGVPAAEFNFWIGLLAPGKTPRDIVQKLNSEIARILLTPEVRDRLSNMGAEPFPMMPAEFDAFMQDEYTALGRVIKPAAAGPK